MAMWSISVSIGSVMRSAFSSSGPPEQRDLVFADLVSQLGIVDAEPLARRKAQHADLALVQVVVHLVGGLAGVGQRVDGREDRLHLAGADELVRVPRLA